MSKILITEDEPHVIRVLKLSLEKHGYQVDQAPNGKVALDKIRQQEPDVLITDLHMPRLSGEALCKQLQEEMPQRKFLIFVLRLVSLLNLSMVQVSISAVRSVGSILRKKR
jgi:CheY-like chemotaxis protein